MIHVLENRNIHMIIIKPLDQGNSLENFIFTQIYLVIWKSIPLK